ncbi:MULTISPECIES: AimR family lysis-lysogeny pheromone receptor [Bacillus subtilis group]|uniref:AimR family lysis-lysogeny pheromone receptor n=1 Tax=Bacillus subtilis group TaxID=653685 RepID=UPI002280FBE7|nr:MULTISPECIES: AimR family lysis-lysogeny pheromone receptor [Bacillus subtilis group]MCY7919105.1 AimR family lysis-lysogeny pheromone receptor [Bacillus vallismortis]MCY9084313.1 AimR family lysis-lysogeny pheromone receptor [Bacillus inaquosorum]MED4799070.1 AimR family lysis-lysogeny pheromone receptor [Bacillus atrophaeus]MED4854830.1 AimR family lysis-lysogeny pheromone receptor [Bacillus atrophaeus]
MKLKQMIKNECEKDNQLAARLAKLAGYEKVNGFYKFVNTPEKEMENLGGLLKVVKNLFPDSEEQLLSEYFLELDPNKKCARQSVEYSDINQWDTLTDKIILNLCNSKNSTSQEWGKVYSLHRKLNKNEISLNDAIRESGKCKIKSAEMLFFSNAMLMYAYLNIGEFGLMKSTSKLLEFDDLPEGFIKESFKSRVSMLEANISLNENSLLEARQHSNRAIEKSNVNRICFFAYLTIGNTLIFEDFDEAKKAYIKGQKYAKNPVHQEMLDGALCFLSNVWKKENQWVNYNSDNIKYLQLRAFYYINQGNIEEATEILDELSSRDQDENELGFYFYYKGLISQDKTDYYKSITYFKKSDDKYFIQLPLLQLEQMGADLELLNLISI